jgi:hypothetical protein
MLRGRWRWEVFCRRLRFGLVLDSVAVVAPVGFGFAVVSAGEAGFEIGLACQFGDLLEDDEGDGLLGFAIGSAVVVGGEVDGFADGQVGRGRA